MVGCKLLKKLYVAFYIFTMKKKKTVFSYTMYTQYGICKNETTINDENKNVFEAI